MVFIIRDTMNTFLQKTFFKMQDIKPVENFQPRLGVTLRPEMPENLKKAWDLAVFETEANMKPCPYGGEYFTAGGRGGWFGMLFGQDTVACGLLALNKLYPELMKNQIRSYVLARLNIGFMGPDEWVVENCHKAIPLNMDVWRPNSREFCDRYHLSPALNRTGQDVGWLWTAGDLFDMHGDRMDWAWLYGMGELFFSHFYAPFYDETDGLYFGQASFIDIGGSAYSFALDGLGGGQKERNAEVWIKASSTNALYVRGMDVLSYAATVLGRTEDAARWAQKADALRKAMRDKLRFPDGTFAYYMHKDGHLEPRREALGAAYSILAVVVTGEDAVKALATDALQFSDAGVSLFYPFYDENPKTYHNHTAWPFASTFYYMAKEKVTGESCMKQDATQLATAIALPTELNKNVVGTLEDYATGTFHEYITWKTHEPKGCWAQTFTTTAFMNLCIRNGWLDQEIPHSRFL